MNAQLDAPAVIDDLLQTLVDIAKRIEMHRTAIWHLEQRQTETRQRLIRAGWRPPKPELEMTS